MRYTLIALKVVFSILVLLFALATFLGKAYLQTFTLLVLVLFFFYWPRQLFKKKRTSHMARIILILILILCQFTLFRPAPKTSIYLSDEYEKVLLEIYTQKLNDWPPKTESLYLDTKYGSVHVLACGADTLPPILLFHAASMGAHSWAENLDPLFGKFRIYAVDNIGEGNRSALEDPMVYPGTPEEIADHYAFIANALNIDKSPVLGASNGGFIAQAYAFYYPDKVQSLALFGPMGLTPLSGRSIFMLSAASLYPLQTVRNHVTKWAFGDDVYCNAKYGDWFEAILKGTIPSVAKPVVFTTEQKQQMKLPVLLFLGKNDPIVGDVLVAEKAAKEFPNIEINMLESGHLIAVEKREFINNELARFLENATQPQE